MNEFPEFIRNRANAVASSQKNEGVEGYVFDGIEGSQAILFQCVKGGLSNAHVHDFDEYFVVIQGEYTLGIEGRKIRLAAGQEYHIPKGIPHDGAFIAGTRTINIFGGKRAERKSGGASHPSRRYDNRSIRSTATSSRCSQNARYLFHLREN